MRSVCVLNNALAKASFLPRSTNQRVQTVLPSLYPLRVMPFRGGYALVPRASSFGEAVLNLRDGSGVHNRMAGSGIHWGRGLRLRLTLASGPEEAQA